MFPRWGAGAGAGVRSPERQTQVVEIATPERPLVSHRGTAIGPRRRAGADAVLTPCRAVRIPQRATALQGVVGWAGRCLGAVAGGAIRPIPTALLAASTREPVPNFSKILRIWRLTVPSVISKRLAMR